MLDKYDELVQLARLSLSGRRQDLELFLRRLQRRMVRVSPETAEQLAKLLSESPTRDAPLRGETLTPVPVDLDSRQKLVRLENPVTISDEPIWMPSVAQSLNEVLEERRQVKKLVSAGLQPTRTLMFDGPPGVGKSLAARWIARELKLPLITLDLATVMSSFLGRTGNNLRGVIDYAKEFKCVFFLDEFDAIANRRADSTDIGELRRLVNVLLQEVDDWPAKGLLVAATNHPDLLDPAVFRRFERSIYFPLPDAPARSKAVNTYLGPETVNALGHTAAALVECFDGASFSDMERELRVASRNAIVHSGSIQNAVESLLNVRVERMTREQRLKVAESLSRAGFTQRSIYEVTGVSRDTQRKHLNTKKVKR